MSRDVNRTSREPGSRRAAAREALRTSEQRTRRRRRLLLAGKPRVLYVGAEYCPYCAAQRWAVAAALSRFGTFADLSETASATDDIHPDTATLSFHGSSYTSEYVPVVLAWCSVGFGLVGLMVSAYLAYEHFSGSTTLACPDTGRINCLKVTSSQYSVVAGVPVALLGTLYFAALLPLLLPVVMVRYLIWAEVYAIGALCLWCTAVHVVTFLLFVTVVFAEVAEGGHGLRWWGWVSAGP